MVLEEDRVEDVVIRELQYDEVPRLNRLVRNFARESKLPDVFNLPVDFRSFVKQIRRAMDVGVAKTIVAERGDFLVGALGFYVMDNLFAGVRQASEFMWYVLPGDRNGPLAIRLFKEYEAHAKEMGCTFISMLHLENSMPVKLKRFYERKGYVKTETTYLKRI